MYFYIGAVRASQMDNTRLRVLKVKRIIHDETDLVAQVARNQSGNSLRQLFGGEELVLQSYRANVYAMFGLTKYIADYVLDLRCRRQQ